MGTKLRILLCSLLLMSALGFASSAYAAEAGLLRGMTATPMYPTVIYSNPSAATDGDLSTSMIIDYNRSLNGGNYMVYTLPEEMVVTHYYMDATISGTMRVYFNDKNGVGQLGLIDTVSASGYMKLATPVKTKTIWVCGCSYPGASYLTIREFDVLGAPVDILPPTVPKDLSFSSTDGKNITVTWTPSVDVGSAGMKGYYVFVDGVQSSLITTTTYSFSSNAGVNRTVQVVAVDNEGNVSAKSAPLTASVAPLLVKPVLSTSAVTHLSMTLDWTNVGAASYDVFKVVSGVSTKLVTTSGQSYSLSLPPSTDIELYVVATDMYNRTVTSDHILARTKDPPAAVVPVLDWNSTISQIQLTWTDSGASYEVWNVFEGVAYKLFTTNQRSYVVSGLSPSTDAEFYVIAVDEFSRRTKSNSVTARTKDLPAPVKPVLSSSGITTNSIQLSWNDVMLGAGSYDLYLKGSPDTKLITLPTTVYRLDDLTMNTPYSFYVVYVDAYGRTVRSDDATFTTSNPPAPVPPVLSVGSFAHDKVSLSWTYVGVAYELFQDGNSILPTSGQSYEVSGLAPDTSYTFKVRAVDLYGRETESAEIVVKTKSIPAANLPVLTTSALAMDSVRLGWTSVSNLPYKVFRNGTLLDTVDNLFLQVNGLAAETDYSFYVVATDSFGRENKSNTVTIKTLKSNVPGSPGGPAVPTKPPPVTQTDNPALNEANDYLIQGAKDSKESYMSMIGTLIGVFILVFGIGWLIKLFKRKMAKANTTSLGAASKLNLSVQQKSERQANAQRLNRSIVERNNKQSQKNYTTTRKVQKYATNGKYQKGS